ncbi:YdcF family protein [Desemzia sp. FAM 23990]|uniref:YdcF family protein n=1 Tax=Desemzia sp. FAM 23990 TaxID=3259520 RepID=UPI0038837731
MVKRKITISVILLIGLVFIVSYSIIINNLIVDEEPTQSDVIIVAEGQDYVRAYRAAELLQEGLSESGKMIVSPVTESNVQGYQRFGIREEQVIPETKATSTYENAVNTLGVMEEFGFDSAIIVSEYCI